MEYSTLRKFGRSRLLLAVFAVVQVCVFTETVWAQGTPTATAAEQAKKLAKEAAEARDRRGDAPSITVFTGISVDSFAAKELRQYLNQEDSSKVSEQLVAGFDFSYRVAGNQGDARQLWLYGETIHGVRSGDVNCTGDNAKTEICKVASLEATNQSAPLAIFRKATSLEALVGVRAEFLTLRSETTAPSQLYVKGQLGFLSVAGRGGDVVDLHHAGVGVTLTAGPFLDSYLELGYGKNDLFTRNPRRWKVDSFLAIGPPDKGIRPFAQMVIDFDGRDGPDTIQSYFGLDIDIVKVFGRNTAN